MRTDILKKVVELVNDIDYNFDLSHLNYLNKLKQETLLLAQIEYECLKKLIDDLEKSTLKDESKKKYANWFSQYCFVHGLITTTFYRECVKKTILKDVFFDLPVDHYAFEYQFKFTANKISYLIGHARKEIDADAFFRQYNDSAKSSGLASKAIITDLFQLASPFEIACFKKTISILDEKAELVQANWYFPSQQRTVSYHQGQQKFMIQKELVNIELKPADFLKDFKNQYRKERPWYGNLSEWLGFGTLSKLNKQSTDVAKVEYLLNHVKKNSNNTTAKTVDSLFHTDNFVEGFKKQYRKERPWYGFIAEKVGAGTLSKLNEQENNPVGFLRNHGKENLNSTTAKTLESLKVFSAYGGGVEDTLFAEKENTPVETAASNRQFPVSSDKLSVDAMIKAREFSLKLTEIEKREWAVREKYAPSMLSLHQNDFGRIAKQEKIERAQKEKQLSHRNFLRDLENQLKIFWSSVKNEKYIEIKDFGVTKIQCQLFFKDEAIAALAAPSAADDAIQIHSQIQSIRVLYEKFSKLRDYLEDLFLSDEDIISALQDFTRALDRLMKKEVIDKDIFKTLSTMCRKYQVSLEGGIISSTLNLIPITIEF